MISNGAVLNFKIPLRIVSGVGPCRRSENKPSTNVGLKTVGGGVPPQACSIRRPLRSKVKRVVNGTAIKYISKFLNYFEVVNLLSK